MMRRSMAVVLSACALPLLMASPAVAGAQQWNDARTRALVEQATQRRAQQIADTALASYKAVAHGYLTFLARDLKLLNEPQKIVKAVLRPHGLVWQAPNLSQQGLGGLRDTLLLPTDI